MMIDKDGITILNLYEQVEKNKEDISRIFSQAYFFDNKDVIKNLDGVVADVSDLPTPTPEMAHQVWGVGSEEPYDYYVVVPPYGDYQDYTWLELGVFPLEGPQGEQGEQGVSIQSVSIAVSPLDSGSNYMTITYTDGTSETLEVSKNGSTGQNQKSLYNLGIYDSIVVNGNKTTITRKTGYVDLGNLNYAWIDGYKIFRTADLVDVIKKQVEMVLLGMLLLLIIQLKVFKQLLMI